MNIYQRLKIASAINGQSIYEIASSFGCHPQTLSRLDDGPISDDIKQKALEYISKAEDTFSAYIANKNIAIPQPN
jgi:hypothetical protein